MAIRLSNKSRSLAGSKGLAAGHVRKGKKPKPHDFGPFKIGGVAYLKTKGFGTTGYERVTVENVTQARVKIKDYEYPFERGSGDGIYPADWPNLGLKVSLCVTPEEITAAENYTAED